MRARSGERESRSLRVLVGEVEDCACSADDSEPVRVRLVAPFSRESIPRRARRRRRQRNSFQSLRLPVRASANAATPQLGGHRRPHDESSRVIRRGPPRFPSRSAAMLSFTPFQAYYNALDAEQPHRATAVAALYAPTCRISWNGNPIPYNDLPAFLTQLPKSVHEVQAFDCHPIPGSSRRSYPP